VVDPSQSARDAADVTPEDRTAAWDFRRFHCLPDSQMRYRWFAGWYDRLSEGKAIQVLAAHRIAAEQRGHARGEAERAALDTEITRLTSALEHANALITQGNELLDEAQPIITEQADEIRELTLELARKELPTP